VLVKTRWMIKRDEYIDHMQLHTVFPKIIKINSREIQSKEKGKTINKEQLHECILTVER